MVMWGRMVMVMVVIFVVDQMLSLIVYHTCFMFQMSCMSTVTMMGLLCYKSYNNYIGYTAVQKELKCPQSDGRVGFRNVLIWGEQSSKGESLISHIVCWVVYFRVLSYDRCRRRGSVCVYIRARVHAKTQRCTAKRRY